MPSQTNQMVIFGDPDLRIWGMLICQEPPRLAVAALDAAAADVQLLPAAIDRDDDQVWTVTAGAHNLRFEMGQASTASESIELPLAPLRVTGTAQLADQRREIDVPGVLSEAALDGGTDSLRLFGSWFPAGHQVVLRAARAKGAKGQDRDVVDVVALGEKEPVVFDPRLSTTYGPGDVPRQTGIELWIGADEDGDQYPRRVAGVATGSSLSDSTGNAKFGAHALRCLSRGVNGVGVYVVLRAA